MKARICWNCKFLCRCQPKVRPQSQCAKFKPYPYKKIPQETIAEEWLFVSRQRLYDMISQYGISKVVELLAIRGYNVRYEIDRNIKFYHIDQ